MFYTNYNKKSYQMWELINGLDYNLGTEYLHKAVGLYFEQIKR
ncbi:hypothetical protein PAJ34TS1_41400 [Paenibacillus azoreducens]|uniref:Uncharacterized protein n=1 Tax=Paenibacillus azoreducens TaxID=116718 RepID=A0A920CW02_9BACL|nr:hypothetical protein J34TS1_56430 [Paenibacillus azoreducens]